MKHVKTMKKLWKAFERFIHLLTRNFDVAIEWPQNCRYWRFLRVLKFINEYYLKRYDFHGCMLGTQDHEGNPIKKPWTVATTMDEIGLELSQYQCDESHDHVQGRGKPLKETESYRNIIPTISQIVCTKLSIGQLNLLERSRVL